MAMHPTCTLILRKRYSTRTSPTHGQPIESVRRTREEIAKHIRQPATEFVDEELSAKLVQGSERASCVWRGAGTESHRARTCFQVVTGHRAAGSRPS